jgi:YbbR domain-containing protein
MKNPFFKLLALLLAVLLWFLVVGEERAEVGLTIPLELVNIPRNLVVVNNITQGIDIRVNGPRSLVRSLSARSLSKSLDLSNARSGTITFPISAEGIKLPRGVTITRVHPPQVVVVLQKLGQKKVAVQARLTGKLPPGFEIVSVRTKPEELEVAGPEEVMGGVETPFTKPIDLGGVRSDLVQEIGVDFRSLQIRALRQETVEVEIKIKKTGR